MLISACRLYEPTVLDCRVTCGADGSCPVDTVCREGFCRLPSATSRCDCRDGETRTCGSSLGACQPGVQTCRGTEWSACEGEVGPASETCNGVDDDCDGAIDAPIALAPPCSRSLGVCSTVTQQCTGGAWVECSELAYGRDFEREEHRCDGLDNDCDGVVDGTREVALAETDAERWFFLGTSRGYALITSNDAGTELRWLSPQLTLERKVQLPAPVEEATSWSDEIVTARATDAGVVFSTHDADGGVRLLEVPGWTELSALDLEQDVAAAVVAGVVQVVSLGDGGAPAAVGASTATLRLSQTGRTLAWSGGLVRTADLTSLSPTSPGALTAVLELPSGAIAGVPASQPGAPAWFSDLRSSGEVVVRAPGAVPRLSGLSAVVQDGEVLIAGVDELGRVWVATAGGSRMLEDARGAERVQVVAGTTLATVAWQRAGRVFAGRRCVP